MNHSMRYRPLEIVHDFAFIPLHLPQNAALPAPRERLDRLKECGYGGVVLNVSFKNYLQDEAAFESLRDSVLYARKLGLTVWIYDEQYYPSGYAGGVLIQEHPECEAKALSLVTATPDPCGGLYVNSPHGHGALVAAFVCEVQDGRPDFATIKDVSHCRNFGGGLAYKAKRGENVQAFCFFGKAAFEYHRTCHTSRTIRRYGDTLQKDAVRKFLDITYHGYKKALGALAPYVEAVFTDEPQTSGFSQRPVSADLYAEVTTRPETYWFVSDYPDNEKPFLPFVPWTDTLPQEFQTRCGYPLLPALPRLFCDASNAGKQIRADFWRVVSDLFCEAYGAQYRAFCESEGIAYSGHFMAEEEFWKHPYEHGDLLRQLGAMHMPGCDMLFASPEKILQSATAPKMAASAAALYGRADIMIEASDIMRDISSPTADDLMRATALQYACGITRFTSYYTEDRLPIGQTKQWCDFTAALGERLDGAVARRYVYVYVPQAALAAESFPVGGTTPRVPYSAQTEATCAFISGVAEQLLRSGIDFCFINDERLQAVGNGDTLLEKDCALVLPPFASPAVPDGTFREVLCEPDFAALCTRLQENGYASCNAQRNVIVLHKQSQTKDVFLLVNCGADYSGNATFSHLLPRTVCLYENVRCGTEKQFAVRVHNGKCALPLTLAAGESACLTLT